MAAFTFSVVEPFSPGNFEDRSPISEGFISQMDYAIDCLAAGELTGSKVRGAFFSPLRWLVPSGTKTGTAASHLFLNRIEKTSRLSIKDTILLKLRI
ncbi:MAG: hypothetical protein LBI94_06205 [Treponema sp.]|nr:hypothetical protein [Treponema sp.]